MAHRRLILTDADHARMLTLCASSKKLTRLLNEAGTFTPAEQSDIDEATDAYGSNEVEIDPDAGISVADKGVWVSAWVWLEREDEESED